MAAQNRVPSKTIKAMKTLLTSNATLGALKKQLMEAPYRKRTLVETASSASHTIPMISGTIECSQPWNLD
ncbi:hypothetical protein CEXT_560861 [Caerostris extrusa]|uniref:Uncharacterized protein n=1 Tax=Caerostris extrusa TaxID=172846 RepID=A0AAV4XGW1_CAEEX|nr:hypothetical protein CEXT_560861 [Caerostris extrusa]